MNFSVMRRVDNFVGTPLCVAFGAVEAVLRLFRRKPAAVDPATVRRVLAMKFVGLGTVAEAVPMFRAMRRRYPNARISFLAFEPVAGLARLLGFDEVRVVRTDGALPFVFDTVGAVVWGWRRRFDVSHDLEFFSKYSYLLSWLIHAPVRVGYFIRSLRRIPLLTSPVPFNPSRHVLESFLAQLGMGPGNLRDGDSNAPALPADAEQAADAVLRGAGLEGAPRLVAVNVNTGEMSLLRLWPPEYHSTLAARLASEFGAAIAFVGDASDSARVEEARSALPAGVKSANLAGCTTLPVLLAVLKRADLVVSNDSGPLHLAALMGTPTVGFFGAESARIYGPRGPRNTNLDRELHCSPCLNVFNFKEYDCPYGVKCMRDIRPEDAFEAARKILGGGRA